MRPDKAERWGFQAPPERYLAQLGPNIKPTWPQNPSKMERREGGAQVRFFVVDNHIKNHIKNKDFWTSDMKNNVKIMVFGTSDMKKLYRNKDFIWFYTDLMWNVYGYHVFWQGLLGPPQVIPTRPDPSVGSHAPHISILPMPPHRGGKG